MKTETKTLLFDLLRNKFDAIKWTWYLNAEEALNLIKATIELDLIDEAKEMILDAKEYGYDYTNLLK
jgi:hypothetical protein